MLWSVTWALFKNQLQSLDNPTSRTTTPTSLNKQADVLTEPLWKERRICLSMVALLLAALKALKFLPPVSSGKASSRTPPLQEILRSCYSPPCREALKCNYFTKDQHYVYMLWHTRQLEKSGLIVHNYTDDTFASILKPRSEAITLNEEHMLVGRDGALIPVVHMYDDIIHSDARSLYNYQSVSSRLSLTREYIKRYANWSCRRTRMRFTLASYLVLLAMYCMSFLWWLRLLVMVMVAAVLGWVLMGCVRSRHCGKWESTKYWLLKTADQAYSTGVAHASTVLCFLRDKRKEMSWRVLGGKALEGRDQLPQRATRHKKPSLTPRDFDRECRSLIGPRPCHAEPGLELVRGFKARLAQGPVSAPPATVTAALDPCFQSIHARGVAGDPPHGLRPAAPELTLQGPGWRCRGQTASARPPPCLLGAPAARTAGPSLGELDARLGVSVAYIYLSGTASSRAG
eukprot:scaffold1594_cov401-Prasinococcus_capsulatus_cf.AAC.27